MKTDFSFQMILLAFLSGLAVAFLVWAQNEISALEDIGYMTMVYGAGLIYGIFTVIPLYLHVDSKKIMTSLIWLGASALSYLIAVRTVVSISPSGTFSAGSNSIDYALGGFIGALILSFAYTIMLPWLRKEFPVNRVALTLLIGAFLPTILVSINDGDASLISMYILWPTILTAVMCTKQS